MPKRVRFCIFLLEKTMQANQKVRNTFKEKWAVVRGDTAYYPVKVVCGGEPILSVHSWDVGGPARAVALVNLHNAMLQSEVFDVSEVEKALMALPSGQWSVQEARMLYPATVRAKENPAAVFTMDIGEQSDATAQYIVDLYRRALEQLSLSHAFGPV